jgi:xylulokinase
MSGTRAVLGIDLGTSQLKALLTTPDGQRLGRGRASYSVAVPADGRAETDPEDWWRAARTAVRKALEEAAMAGSPASAGGGHGRTGRAAGAGAGVIGLAVVGQMHGVVLADAAGMPVRPAILWLDRRAVAEAAEYNGLPAERTASLGNQPSPGMAGPILRWLTRHEPRAVQRARWALQPKDWLRMRLTGVAAADPTDASGTLLFDLPGNAWARDLVGALQIPDDKLPEIREPAEIAGRLLGAPAHELGLPPGIPVAVGAADTAASLFAVCDREPGARGLPDAQAALLTLGTGGQWVVPAGSFRPAAGTNLFRAIGEGYYRLAASQNVGATLNWVKNLLGVSWNDLYGAAARPWRPDTPVFLPYLAAERWDGPAGFRQQGNTAKGAWCGLTLAHEKDDLLRAALEGVAFLLRDRLEDLREAGHDPRSAVLGGGGARHPAWQRLLADVLGLPLHPAPTMWLSAAGAVMVAAAATEAAVEAATGTAGNGVSRVRSEYMNEEAVAPCEQGAASAAYGRFLDLRRSSPTS